MTETSGFTARTGHERPDETASVDRARHVDAAWSSLLRIRRMVQPDRPDLPAPWERSRPLQSVGLTLEAAGIQFCEVDDQGTVVHSGVRLSQDGPATVRVAWRHRRGERPADAGEARLGEAAEVLARAGWEALLYRAQGSRYLLVEPARD